MALINCPDCNRRVSDAAVACPNCARPIRGFPQPPAGDEYRANIPAAAAGQSTPQDTRAQSSWRTRLAWASGIATTLASTWIIGTADPTGFFLMFILPVGAMLVGWIGAAGFYLGPRFLHYRPERHHWKWVLISALVAFMFGKYLDYVSAEFDGVLISRFVGFGEYYWTRITHAELAFMTRGGGLRGETGQLGIWGVGLELLKLAGYLLPFGLVVFFLSEKRYCKPCGRYFREKVVATDSAEQKGDISRYLNGRGLTLPGLADEVERKARGRAIQAIHLSSAVCSSCEEEYLRVAIGTGRDNEPVKDYHVPGKQTV